MKLYNVILQQNNKIFIPRRVQDREQRALKVLLKMLNKNVIKGDIIIDCSLIPQDFKSKVRHITGSIIIQNATTLQFFQNLQKVDKNFVCSGNKLKSLKGCSEYVGGSFNCKNNQLTSLQYAPKYVGGNFWCDYNQLTSLKYAPKHVGSNFWCSNNTKQFTQQDVRKVSQVAGDIYV